MSLYLMTDHVRIVYEVLCASGHGKIVEAQTAEEVCPRLSRVTIIDLQMPASRILAVNRYNNIHRFQHLMRGHGVANMRHTYTLVWRSTATFICGGYATPDYLQVHIFIRVQFIVPFRVPVLVEAGQDRTCVG